MSVPVVCYLEGTEVLQGMLVPFVMEVNTPLDQKTQRKEVALVGQVAGWPIAMT